MCGTKGELIGYHERKGQRYEKDENRLYNRTGKRIVVITAGVPVGVAGNTNMIQVVEVK